MSICRLLYEHTFNALQQPGHRNIILSNIPNDNYKINKDMGYISGRTYKNIKAAI